MVDITHKTNTLRYAKAQAIVRVRNLKTIEAIHNKTVPKGDVLEMAKTAGLLGIKKTSDLIPDCHPLPIEYTNISYEIRDIEVHICVEVKTIYKTGVEVEAMHGASIVALTMYDMLKPIDKGVTIHSIQLLEKKGGKSNFKDTYKKDVTAAVIVCSDSISAGKKQDKAGKAIIDKLKDCNVTIAEYTIIPDEEDAIEKEVVKHSAEQLDLIIFTGGTGLSRRDITTETIRPLLDREIPGIAEAMRKYGQDRTPYSMLSRSIAGVRNNSLILALPGSTNGARESMEALFPSLLHIFNVMKGMQHDSVAERV